MAMRTGIAIGPLIILAIIVVGLIVLFVKSGRTGRWVVGLMAAVFLIGVLVLRPLTISLHRARSVAVQSAHPGPTGPGSSRSIEVSSSGPRVYSSVPLAEGWLPGGDREFEADVYPSFRSAVLALSSRVENAIAAVVGKQSLSLIKVGGEADRELLSELGRKIQAARPDANCLVEPGLLSNPGRPAENEVWILAEVPQSEKRWCVWSPDEVVEGRVKLTARGAERASSVGVRFVDKPWVEQPVEFVARHPDPRWVVAYSDRPGLSQDEAMQCAIRLAAAKLEPDVRHRLAARPRRWWSSLEAADGQGLRGRIEAELRTGRYIRDRFVQCFKRSYGNVWHGAVLVNASPGSIAMIAHEATRPLIARWTSLMHTAFAAAGLLVLICVVYLFLNAATKGYYVWALRGAVIVVLAAGALLVLVLA